MKITENVYQIDSAKQSNCYIIMNEVVILIDTGLPVFGKGILKELDQLNIKDKLDYILLTHHDMDHIGNLTLIEKETQGHIFASKEDIPYITNSKKREGFKKIMAAIIRHKSPKNIKSFPENNILNNIQIIKTPGHTPGHVCLLYKDVLFIGDLFETKNDTVKETSSFWNRDSEMNKKSIEKILEYKFNWICPGHGNPIKVNNKVLDEIWSLTKYK